MSAPRSNYGFSHAALSQPITRSAFAACHRRSHDRRQSLSGTGCSVDAATSAAPDLSPLCQSDKRVIGISIIFPIKKIVKSSVRINALHYNFGFLFLYSSHSFRRSVVRFLSSSTSFIIFFVRSLDDGNSLFARYGNLNTFPIFLDNIITPLLTQCAQK